MDMMRTSNYKRLPFVGRIIWIWSDGYIIHVLSRSENFHRLNIILAITLSFTIFNYFVFFGVCGSSSMSLLLRVDVSRLRLELLELLDANVVLTHSAGQPQFSEQALLFLRHLHRMVLQSVLQLQDACTSEFVELMDAVNELGRFMSCLFGMNS